MTGREGCKMKGPGETKETGRHDRAQTAERGIVIALHLGVIGINHGEGDVVAGLGAFGIVEPRVVGTHGRQKHGPLIQKKKKKKKKKEEKKKKKEARIQPSKDIELCL